MCGHGTFSLWLCSNLMYCIARDAVILKDESVLGLVAERI